MTTRLHQPRFWLITVTALLMAAATFSLGQWQLRRAAHKEALQTAIELQAKLPILDARALTSTKNKLDVVHRQAALTGVWRPEFTIFLDNRPMSGKTGFVVVTPLVLDGSSEVILVQRGWAQRNFTDRTRLPDISTPQGSVTLHGRIAPSPSKLYEFKGMESGHIRQNIDVTVFGKEIGMPLLAVSLLQTDAANEGLLRDWAVPNAGVDKHYGYAFQWFGLCALLFILYIWFQVISPLRLKKT